MSKKEEAFLLTYHYYHKENQQEGLSVNYFSDVGLLAHHMARWNNQRSSGFIYFLTTDDVAANDAAKRQEVPRLSGIFTGPDQHHHHLVD